MWVVLIYKGCSKSNASYFIMWAHNIRGKWWWWDSSRSWTFSPILHYILLCKTDGSRRAVWQNGTWHEWWSKGGELNSSMWEKIAPTGTNCFLHPNQLNHKSWQIATRELCMQLDAGFNALKMTMATLEYHQACITYVLWMLTEEQKKSWMQLCQDPVNQHEAEGDSFLDCIITSDKIWHHHYEPQSKQQPMK